MAIARGDRISEKFAKKSYLEHLERVRNAKAKVQCIPNSVEVKPGPRSKVEHQNANLIMIIQKNIALLANIMLTVEPDVRSYGKQSPIYPHGRMNLIRRNHAIHKENLKILKRLEEIKRTPRMKFLSKCNTLEAQGKRFSKRRSFIANLPKCIPLELKDFRPRVYFKFITMSHIGYDRIVFELYPEACPALVLEFLRFFSSGKCDNLHFMHIYSTFWLEVLLNRVHEKWESDEYDLKVLDYTKEPGMLLFAIQDFDAFKKGDLMFSITFRPLNVFDNKRFAFGKIVRGKNGFMRLQDRGTKAGTIKEKTIITEMGILSALSY